MATNALNRVIQHLRRTAVGRDSAGPADAELLDCYLARRDEGAFEALVRRHGPMVLGVCRRILRNEADAEDAFQATFLILVRKAGNIRPRGMVSNWLYGVAHNTALKAKAMIHKRRTKEREAGKVTKPEAAKEVWSQVQTLVDEELGRLPDKYRVPIVLCDLEGKTIKEAARHLDWPQGTVATRLSRGRALLAKRLCKHGPTLSVGPLAAVLSQAAASARVPPPLVASTVKAASLYAAGKAVTTGVVSATVAALTEGVLTSMLLTKLKIAMAALLVIALIGGGVAGVSMLTPKAVATNQVETKTDEPEKPTSPSRSLKGEYKFLSLSLGRDGKTLATVTMDAGAEPGDILAKTAVRLWDVQSGSVKRTLAEDQIKDRGYSTYAGVGLSADGKMVAAPACGKLDGENGFNWLVLWDVETGKIRHKLKHGLEVRALAFSPDGKTVATGTGGNTDRDFETVKLWNVQTGQLRRTLETTNKGAVKVVFAPDSKLLAAVLHQAGVAGGAPAEVILWDPAEGKSLQTLPDSDGIEAIAFSPDGKTLLGAARTKLRVWDVSTGKTIQGSELKTGFSDEGWSAIAFSPDGKTLAISPGMSVGKQDDKHVIALYDVKTAKRTKTLEGHKGFIHVLCFSPDSNTLASGGYEDQTIYLWDFDRGTKPKKFLEDRGRRYFVLQRQRVEGKRQDGQKKPEGASLLEGTWVFSQAFLYGKKLPNDEARMLTGARWTFRGQEIQQDFGDGKKSTGQFRVNLSPNPAWLDFETPSRKMIFQVKGKTLEVAVTLPDPNPRSQYPDPPWRAVLKSLGVVHDTVPQKRPAELKSSPDTDVVLLVFERETAPAAPAAPKQQAATQRGQAEKPAPAKEKTKVRTSSTNGSKLMKLTEIRPEMRLSLSMSEDGRVIQAIRVRKDFAPWLSPSHLVTLSASSPHFLGGGQLFLIIAA